MKSAGQVICMANKFKFDDMAVMDDRFQISIMFVMVNVKQYLLRKDLSPENYYDFEKKKTKIKYSRHVTDEKLLFLKIHVQKAHIFHFITIFSRRDI